MKLLKLIKFTLKFLKCWEMGNLDLSRKYVRTLMLNLTEAQSDLEIICRKHGIVSNEPRFVPFIPNISHDKF